MSDCHKRFFFFSFFVFGERESWTVPSSGGVSCTVMFSREMPIKEVSSEYSAFGGAGGGGGLCGQVNRSHDEQ